MAKKRGKKKGKRKAKKHASAGLSTGAEAIAQSVYRRTLVDPETIKRRTGLMRLVFSGEGLFTDEPALSEVESARRQTESGEERYARFLSRIPLDHPEREWWLATNSPESLAKERDKTSDQEHMHRKVRAMRKRAKSVCCAPGCSQTQVPQMMQCSACGVRVFCGAVCQATAWKAFHKSECKLFKKCKALPSESADAVQLQFKDGSGGWKVGFTPHGAAGHVWVMCVRANDGRDSNQHVLLGRRATATAEPSVNEVVKAVCKTMLSPRHDTLSCAGPRMPWCCSMQSSLPVAVQRGAAALLTRLGVHTVDIPSLASADDAARRNSGLVKSADAASFIEQWYRIDAGLPAGGAGDEDLFECLIDPTRRVPLAPSAWHLRPSHRRERTAEEVARIKLLADTDDGTIAKAKTLPRPGGAFDIFAHSMADECDLQVAAHDGEIFVWQPFSKGFRVVHRRPCALDRKRGQPPLKAVIGAVCCAMLTAPAHWRPTAPVPGSSPAPASQWRPHRPTTVMVAQPSIASMLTCGPLDEAFEAMGVHSCLAAPMSMEKNLEGLFRDGRHPGFQAWPR